MINFQKVYIQSTKCEKSGKMVAMLREVDIYRPEVSRRNAYLRNI